ncbi:hypothetical protein FRACYDRAFT_253489 [Fragilariopsis cylindrus CCMP1102]|uniref:Uncharacterized protein n=1 Tax=Fragilariopsis cylindrus CCMP1102 TaxID=635003 RepID=A0A1E7ELL3_9STRA|nr:hypothetical protein FRACYDRAFT_253489 [Fragilariopsis cylindrus CCMP1102]|eukprot:OEU06736.1 hypothetical protein FRACYDRAFT_253489 [Fragilariopsis cylindrus CCMP1102]
MADIPTDEVGDIRRRYPSRDSRRHIYKEEEEEEDEEEEEEQDNSNSNSKSQLKPYEKNSVRDQERQAKGQIRTGKWTEEESMAFLHGVRICGWGNWSIIADDYIPTRTTRQVKSKAQTESKYDRNFYGRDPGKYSELDKYLKEHPDFWKNMKTKSVKQQTKSTTRTKMNKKISNHKMRTRAQISSQKSLKKQKINKENGVTGGGAGDDGTTTGASVVDGDGDEDVFYDAVQELNE